MSDKRQKAIEALERGIKHLEKAFLEFESDHGGTDEAKEARYHRRSMMVTFEKLQSGEATIADVQLVRARCESFVKRLIGI